MPTGAPLPVREFASVAEMQAHAREVRARIWCARPPARPEPRVEIVPAALAADLSALELVEPGHAKPIVDAFVEKALAEHGVTALPETAAQREGRASLRGSDCLRIVSEATGVTAAAMKGQRRITILVRARQIAMWLMVNRAGKSFPGAGALMGGRDHTTVMHGCRRVEAMMRGAGIADEGEAPVLVARLWSSVAGTEAPPCA